ncbi:MAG: hypothetical protein IJ062_10940 [Firmicutes bacterium]|nr:hypothetical protein [Bacillota bacterium]
MKNKYIFIAVVLVLLFCMTSGTFAEGLYKGMTANVPVSFVSKSGTSDCTIVMETMNDSPEPFESELTLSSSGTEDFKMNITEPGNYKYKVYQRPGEDKNITYDDTVYTVTLYVTESTENTLKYAVVAATDKSDDKPDKVEFVNQRTSGGNDEEKDDNKEQPDRPQSTDDTGRTSSGGGKSTPLNKRVTTTVTDKPDTPDAPDTPNAPDTPDDTNSTDDPSNGTDNSVIGTDGSDIGTDSADKESGDSGNIIVTDKDKTDEQITTETAVNTGDRNRQDLWLAVMCASLAVVVISTLAEKRYNKIIH